MNGIRLRHEELADLILRQLACTPKTDWLRLKIRHDGTEAAFVRWDRKAIEKDDRNPIPIAKDVG